MTEDTEEESGDCVFCQIIKDKINAHKVYEDDKAVAFLDLNPVSKGHTLVVPKKHVETIYDAEGMNHIWDVIVDVSNSLKEAFDPKGLKVAQNNGEAAGQEIFHMHFHLTPIYDGNELQVNYNREELQEAEKILDRIREEMD